MQKMDNFNKILCQSGVSSSKNYWKAINLYTQKPHLINRKLIGAEILTVLNYIGAGDQFLKSVKNISDRLIKFSEEKSTIDDKTLLGIVGELGLNDYFRAPEEGTLLDFLERSNNLAAGAIAVNKLIPKNVNTNAVTYEFIVFGRFLIINWFYRHILLITRI